MSASFTPRPTGWSGGRQPSLTRLRDFGLARLDALAEIFGCGFGRPDSCNENEKPRPHWNDRGEKAKTQRAIKAYGSQMCIAGPIFNILSTDLSTGP